MKGAREYAELFQSGQYGRLYLASGGHARGRTFKIFLLPTSGEQSQQSWRDAVEVYGIIRGQPGWTEEYGWLHRGPWQADFEKLVEARRAEIAAAIVNNAIRQTEAEEQEALRVAGLLANYKPGEV